MLMLTRIGWWVMNLSIGLLSSLVTDRDVTTPRIAMASAPGARSPRASPSSPLLLEHALVAEAMAIIPTAMNVRVLISDLLMFSRALLYVRADCAASRTA